MEPENVNQVLQLAVLYRNGQRHLMCFLQSGMHPIKTLDSFFRLPMKTLLLVLPCSLPCFAANSLRSSEHEYSSATDTSAKAGSSPLFQSVLPSRKPVTLLYLVRGSAVPLRAEVFNHSGINGTRLN